MATLLIDHGNTNVKFALLENGQVKSCPRQGVEHLVDALALSDGDVWMSSVGDTVLRERIAGQCVGMARTCHRINIEQHTDKLTTSYDIQSMGVDRWLVLLGCYERNLYPCVVVDSGTATTIDLMNAQGEHEGGYILPGLSLAQSALTTNTCIPEQPELAQQVKIPMSTAETMNFSMPAATAALAEQCALSLANNATIILTGGGATALSAHMSSPVIQAEYLVFEGLAALANK
jgi:type III pantothenate kinase